MAYIGNTQLNQNYVPAIDYFSGNGSTTAFTLSRPVASVAQVQAVIENVPQNPGDAYTVSGNTITFTSAPPSGTNNIYVYYTSPNTQVVQPGQGTVGTIQMADGVTVNFNDGSAAAPSITNTGDTNTGMFFPAADTIAFAEGGTEVMRIDSSGNVGIGTSSPAAPLDVVSNSGSTGVNIRGRASDNFGSLYFTSNASIATEYAFIQARPTVTYFYTVGSNPLALGTNSTERMRIDANGRVQINDTAPVSGLTAKLTITSATATESNITLKDSGTTYATGTQYISFANSSNASAGSIQHTAVTTVAYATTSDARLKENIKDALSSLDKIAQAKVRSFDWKEDKKHVDYGFIAQELYEVYPDAVCKGDDSVEIENPKETWQVDYGRITPLLLKAIQELKAIVDEQAEKIKALEAK